MADIGKSFFQLIQSLTAVGSTSSNFADLAITGTRARVIPVVDYGQFGKHVYFANAVRKFRNSVERIEDTYPIGLSGGDVASLCAENVYKVDQWKKESSGFDLWLLDELSITDSVTAIATNQKGENVVLTHVIRNATNTITGTTQVTKRASISGRAEDFEQLNIDIIPKSGGSANDHNHWAATAEQTVTRGPVLKNMLPEILFWNDDNEILDKTLQSFGDLLDEIKAFADNISYLKYVNYDDNNRSPNKFLPVLANHFGVTLYQSAVNTAIEQFLIQSTTGYSVQEIAYETWNRILNNLSYLIKNKGTREAIESIGRLYGIDHNILSVDEYAIAKKDMLTKVREEVDTPVLFSTGDVHVQLPANSVSAFDYDETQNFTIQMRVSATSATEQVLLMHPLYMIKLDASGQAHFVATAGITASTTQSSISSFIQTKDKFVNVIASRKDDALNIWTMVLSGSGSGGDDIIVSSSSTTAGVQNLNYDSSGGFNSFGTYFPASGSFNGYMHEVRVWGVPLHEEDLKEHTRNFESTSINNSTANNSAKYSSLSAHYKLKENIVLTGGYNYIVDSTTGSNTGAPINFENQSTKRYRVFSNMEKITYWYPTSLMVDNDKVRQNLDVEKLIKDPGTISIHIKPINAINRDIRNMLQNVNIKELLGDPEDLYNPGYRGPITAAMNDVRSRYGNVVTEILEAGSGLSAAAPAIADLNTFIDAMDNFNDVLGGIFAFADQFIPAKSNVLSKGLLVETHILHRPKIKRKEYDVVKLTATTAGIATHYVELDATAVSAATTAMFQGYRFTEGIETVLTNSITSGNQAIKSLSNKGDSINVPRFLETRTGRLIPAKVTPADPDASEIQATLSRVLISPTASPSAVNANIDGIINLLVKGKPFTTNQPALRFNFPASSDGTNYFIATIGDIDNGKGRIIDGKNTEFTTKLDSKNLQMKLKLADVTRSYSADPNSSSGEVGIVGIDITNLFNNTTQTFRIAIGNRQELFNEFTDQGGIKINS